jgi:hypothetical protein
MEKYVKNQRKFYDKFFFLLHRKTELELLLLGRAINTKVSGLMVRDLGKGFPLLKKKILGKF